jgi:type III restriction enzyme
MKLKFDPNQQFQQDAINAVVDLFEGQPQDAGNLISKLQETNVSEGMKLLKLDEVGAVGNNLILDQDAILQNLKRIQDRNGLKVTDELDGMNFSVEMETGTGKTYVYLRSIFEMAKKYNFTKFIILVPSVAIREGVATSIRLMKDHFTELFAQPFDNYVYSGKNPDDVRSFATSTNIQIMIMTIQSVKGNKDTLIMHNSRNQLSGLAPIDFLNATQPIVIMDEPQNMEGELAKSALKDLNPLCTLRYSATHKNEYNLVYRLDPVDAHEQGLVKQIVVADVVQQGADAKPYIKLLEVNRDPWRAKLELVVRTTTGLQRKAINVSQHQDLAQITKNDAYSNNWRINEINIEPGFIELTNHGILHVGESIGDNNSAIYKEMIRETIKEHLKKEYMLRDQGIKVLSLFFIDKVANYLDYDNNGEEIQGQFATWFDEVFEEERNKSDMYKELLPQDPSELRKAYFSIMKKGGKKKAVDSSEKGNQNDNDAYDLIMKDKVRLLSEDEPVRFIFSHSALREGWDNPNVFQICVLREMGATLERRQTIGRGLRLPVRVEEDELVRVGDSSIAQLTVIANESYREFADSLQKEYKSAGVSIGFVRKEEFSKIPDINEDGAKGIGFERSVKTWKHLHESGMIDEAGKVLPAFNPSNLGFTLNLPEELKPYEPTIISIVRDCKIEKFVKQAKQRQQRKLNSEVLWSPEFEEFWYKIAKRTTYHVKVSRDETINKSVEAIKREPYIQPLRIEITRSGVKVLRGGAKGEQLGIRSTELSGSYDLPNIVKELQEATSLTRKTIVDILIASNRLQEFIHNPNDFIQMTKRVLLDVLAKTVIDGIQYDEISGNIYELRELQEDGEQEKARFLDQMYKVKNNSKTVFDYVVYDSEPEQEFAELLDSREDIKLFMKLPDKFKIPTPVGDYNPDWAIVKQEDGREKIYMIRETKSTQQESLLRASEQAKIDCGKKHFEAIGINDYAKSSPGTWNI